MEYRRLGRTDLQVSVVGLGTGGPSLMGQRTHGSVADAKRVVRRALDLGVTFFDTAYGYRDSELWLAGALEGVPRDDYVLATKYRYADFETGEMPTPDELRVAIDQRLARLGVDTIDLLQIHGLMPDEYDAVIEAHLPVLREAQAAGKFRFLGVTERFFDDPRHETLQRALEDDHFDTMMVGYNLLSQSAERVVIPQAAAKDVGVIIMAAVRVAMSRPQRLCEVVADLKARGLLAADALDDDDPLGWLVHDHVTSIPSAAYKFVLGPPGVSTVLSGTSNADHLAANVEALLGPPLPAADRARLVRALGHLEEALGG